MKTIGQHISNIRAQAKLYSRTLEGYTDESLYNLFSISAAEVIKNELKKFNAVSEDNWIQFCMKLQVTKWHNCDCVPENLDCKILQSTFSVPTAIVSRQKSKIKIRTISGKTINIVSEEEWFRKKRIPTKNYYGSIINNKLIIWNAPLALKVVLISGIWSDPITLNSIPNCSVDGDVQETSCFEPLNQMYPLQDEYTRAVYDLTLKSLMLNIPQDKTNNSVLDL